MKKLFYLFAIWSLGVQNVLAQVHLDPEYLGDGADSLIKYESDTAEGALNKFLLDLADTILYFAAGIAVIALVIGAAYLVKSRNNDEQIAKAKVTITWSIIGLFTVILSYSLVRTVIYLVFTVAD